MLYEHTVQVDDYNIEKECVYKNEDYLVSVNGAVLRFPLDGKKARPVDNKWTFGTKCLKARYMTIGRHRVHIILTIGFMGQTNLKNSLRPNWHQLMQ